MKEALSQADIKFAYFDITESMGNLKRFLAIRDVRSEFDDAKKEGRVGLPTIIVDDEILFELPENLDELR